jgi:hypothetical protein
MINQVFAGTPTSRRFVAMPSGGGIVAGQPLLIGNLPCIALDSYQANTGGATCLFNGTFALSVTAETLPGSPPTGKQINPGDPVYATGGTKDATTNVTYGISLSADSAGTLFGYLDPQAAAIPSATTNAQAPVLLTTGG